MTEAYEQALAGASAATRRLSEPPIIVQLFDGARLSFPSGTPEDVIDRVAKEETSKRRASKIAHGEQGGVLNTANQFAAGFNRAMFAIPEAVAGVMEDIYPRRNLPFETPGFIKQAGDLIEHVQGRDVPLGSYPALIPPTTAQGRIANQAGHVAGTMAQMAGGTVAAAPRLAAMTEGATGLGGQIVNTMARGVAANPTPAFAGELMAGATSGAGMGVANEAFPGNRTAELIGGILGGFGPGAVTQLTRVMPSRLLARPAYNLGSKLVAEVPPSVRNRVPLANRIAEHGQQLNAADAQNVIQGALGEALTPGAATSLQRAEQLKRVMPGFNPTLAEATGSRSLRSTQENIERQASGGELEKLARRRAGSEAAISDFARRAAPQGEGGAEFVIDTATRRIDRLRSTVSQQALRATEHGEQNIAGALPEANRAALGADLRTSLVEARREASNQMSALRYQLGLNNANVSVPFNRFRREVEAEFRPSSVFEDKANYPRAVKDILEANQGTVTFSDMITLRERLSDDLIDAMSTPSGRTKQVRHLVALKEKVDGLIDSLATQGRFVESGSQQMMEAARRLKRGPMPQGESLSSWIVRKGGLRDEGGELSALDARLARPGFVNNRTGRTFEDAAQAAWEDGFFPGTEAPTQREFMEALQADLSGRRRTFRLDDTGAQRNADLRQWDQEFSQAGIDWRNMTEPQIDSAILQKFGTPQPAAADLAQRYRQFRDTYRREFVDRFEQGAAFKVRQKDGQGFYRVPDEQVAAAFFSPGDIAGARQFKRVFGNDPAALDALESVALDDLRQAAVREGQLVPNLMQTWTRRHASVLDEFPSIKRTVSAYAQAQNALVARQAQLVARSRGIEDQLLVKALRKYQSGQITPEQIINNALTDPRKMLELRIAVKSDEAVAALRRHVWDSIADQPAPQIERFLDQHAKSLEQLFAPQHLADLRRIMDARRMMESVPPPHGQGVSADPLKTVQEAIGMGVPQLASRFWAVHSGRAGIKYVATDVFGRFFRARRQQEIQRLWKEALYNPDVARDMATMASIPKYPQQAMRKMNLWLFNLGFAPIDEDTQRSQER